MKESSAVAGRVTIGIDLGDQTSDYCVLEAERGDVVSRGKFDSTQKGLERVFATRSPALVVIEAGTHSPWASRLLMSLGHEVVVANSRKVRLISNSSRKTDRMDAETLARLARADVRLLYPIQHRTAAQQEHLAVLRARDVIVRQRTALINHIRGATKSTGMRLPSCTAPAFVTKAGVHIPAAMQMALAPMLRMVRAINATIAQYDKRLEALCDTQYPHTALLRQVKGVGPVTALAFVLVVGSPDRFRVTRTVGAYLGLCPWTSQSGESNPQLHISKSGDALTRRLLVSSSQYILGPLGQDCTLRRIGLKLRAVGGRAAKKRSVIAVARRLAILLLHLWRTAEVYEPLRDAPALEPALAPQPVTAQPALK